MDPEFALQPRCLIKIPLGPSPKRGPPDRSTPQRVYSSPQRTLSPHGSASPSRSEPATLPRNIIFMGAYPPAPSSDLGRVSDRSNLIMLCRDKATQTYFIAFVMTAYATDWGKLPAPHFEMYTLRLHDNYLVYKLCSISKFQYRCRAPKSELGITIHGIARLASHYIPTTDILAPQIFALDLNLAEPTEALVQIYHNQILVNKDPALEDSSAEADLKLFYDFVADVDTAHRYHRRVKSNVTAQIRDAWALMTPPESPKDSHF